MVTPAGLCTPFARATLQRVMFKSGRASVSQLQREHSMGWDEARDLLLVLYAGGWLEGLDISPHVRWASAPA
jgi:hypothetical protein